MEFNVKFPIEIQFSRWSIRMVAEAQQAPSSKQAVTRFPPGSVLNSFATIRIDILN